MKRLLGLSILGLAFAIAGCGSDPREGLISTTIENMRNAASQLANIKDRINEMVKKTDKGTPDMKPVLEAVKSLKDIAKDVQKLLLQTEKIKEPLSEEDQKRLTSKYGEKLNDAITQINKERKGLKEALDSAEAKFKDAAKDLRKRIEETDGEFEVIARTR